MMLRQHPNVFVNPVKEIRYFFEALTYPQESLFERFRNSDWHNEFYIEYLKSRLKFYVKHPLSVARCASRLTWDCRYLLGRRSDEWYQSLFSTDASKITGDFSVQTYRLPPDEIARISREWPDLKILFGLREPIDWTWSYASMSLFGDREPTDVSDAQFRNHFRLNAAEYPTVSKISAWERAFPERFQIVFYDDLTKDPARVLADVCSFLGLDTQPITDFEGIMHRVYAGRHFAMPAHYRAMLIELYEDKVRQLADRFGGHPQRWLERYNQGR